jgi:hypothetical protein
MRTHKILVRDTASVFSVEYSERSAQSLFIRYIVGIQRGSDKL